MTDRRPGATAGFHVTFGLPLPLAFFFGADIRSAMDARCFLGLTSSFSSCSGSASSGAAFLSLRKVSLERT